MFVCSTLDNCIKTHLYNCKPLVLLLYSGIINSSTGCYDSMQVSCQVDRVTLYLKQVTALQLCAAFPQQKLYNLISSIPTYCPLLLNASVFLLLESFLSLLLKARGITETLSGRNDSFPLNRHLRGCQFLMSKMQMYHSYVGTLYGVEYCICTCTCTNSKNPGHANSFFNPKCKSYDNILKFKIVYTQQKYVKLTVIIVLSSYIFLSTIKLQ